MSTGTRPATPHEEVREVLPGINTDIRKALTDSELPCGAGRCPVWIDGGKSLIV